VLQASDLYVYVNGALVTSGITKNGIGVASGGTVVFAVAPANGVSVILEREVALERTTDYQQNGDFLARVVNPDFNRIWMALQQMFTGLNRVMRFPKTDVDPGTELPTAAERADKLLSFDSDGNPVVVAASAQSATALAIQLISNAGSSIVNFLQSGAGAIAITLQSVLRDYRPTPRQFGGVGDGVVNDTAAFTSARTATGGRYHVGPGTWLVDPSPNVWDDNFTASPGAFLKISGITYDIGGAFAGGMKSTTTQRYTTWTHSRIGVPVVIWSDGETSGDSHRLFLPFDIRRNSHVMIFAPGTNGGSCDVLWRRSDANVDAYGNRFSQTFEEASDRILHSYATTASGATSFDAYIRCYGGTSASLDFPALAPCFRQGWSMQNRAETGYKLAWTIGTDRHHIKDFAGTFTHMTFRNDGSVGFFGAGGVTRPNVTGSRGGNAALASLITGLSQLGLITDSTTA
jgi:hypothetical protein